MTNEAAKTNGFQPAYPTEKDEDRLLIGGLTKREAFAQSAQAALLGKAEFIQELTERDSLAKMAVVHADALLEALEK